MKFNSDTKFIEERYEYELEITALKVKEAEDKNLRLEQKAQLERIAEEIISDRLSTVVQVFARTASGQGDVDDYVRGKMEELMADKDEFVLTTMMSYSVAHPKFVNYLRNQGLSEWETGYCCFYAMGLRGKEIGNLINNGSHSHHNRASIIRRKLGLGERDMNLGQYCQKLLRDLEKKEIVL